MTAFENRYIEYFTPLIQDFIRDVEPLTHPKIKDMPQPFLPLFGKSYASSDLKLIIIGQDTAGWWDLRKFIDGEKTNPGSQLLEGLNMFRSHKFTSWGRQRQTFWGFAMMFLAALHGQDDWGAMKKGEMVEILDSFAWGNGNALELYTSIPSKIGIPAAYWNSVRRAGEQLNRFRHIYETLRPNVVLVMYKGMNLSSYFDGYQLTEISPRDGRLAHYRLVEHDVDVFHVPHPRSMNCNEGTNYFRDKLKELFVRHEFIAEFNKFLSCQQEGKEAMNFLHAKASVISPDIDKYEFIARVADELKKRDAFMSVPALMDLVNAKGGKTNYGAPFSGGRGSYRLVSGAYWRMEQAGNKERAHNVAVAFRRPNFEYAYSTD